MSNAVTPEMIKLLNNGDQRELRAFLTLYARPVYERAFAITGDDGDAKRVTRRVISETALLAVKGKLEEDVDAQLMALTDACCSEDLFFARLVDDTMRELASHPVAEPDRLPDWAAARPPARAAAGVSPGERELSLARAKDAPSQDSPMERAEPAPPVYANATRLGEDAYPPALVIADDGAEELPDLFADEEAEAEAGDAKPSPLIVVLIFTLSLVTVALVWVLLVKLMYLGFIPKFDFGFAEWFNAHLFLLY